MTLRKRHGKWNYRFKLDGKEYSGTTDLDATKQNATEARDIEAEHRRSLKEGSFQPRRLVVREFCDADTTDALISLSELADLIDDKVVVGRKWVM